MIKGPSILIVEDNRGNLTILKKMFLTLEFNVTATANGVDALFHISSSTFDLILLDINLPDISGFEILTQVRESFSIAELPVIMLTASLDNKDVVKALSLGANDYITKPFDFPIIESRVKTQLNLKKTAEALRISEERYALASQATKDGLWDYFVNSETVYVSPNWKKIVGIDEEMSDVPLSLIFSLIHPADIKKYKQLFDRLAKENTKREEMEHRIRFKDDSYRWVTTAAVSVHNPKKQTVRILGSMSDITNDKLYSPFANLPNAILIQDRIEQILKQIRANPSKTACTLFLNLKNFRHINQIYGVIEGDAILLQVAERLSSILSKKETLAHAGRDEFIIIIEDFKGIQEIQSRMGIIQERLSQPFFTGKKEEIEITACSGIVIIEAKYKSAKKIIQDAETAMNIAKKDTLQKYHFFKEEFYKQVLSKVNSEKRLRKAFRNNELVLYYQPQISVKNNKLAGFEALLRWEDPERGLIMPNQIIPLAEETGLIIEIGEWTLKEVCRQMKEWIKMDFEPCRIAVNLSPIHFKNKDILSRIGNIIKEGEIDPQYLEMEITETKAMEDPEKNIAIMNELKKLGISFSIDDFGTGYSSLSMLRKFPLSTLKIDKSFINDIHKNEDALSIVSAIIALAQHMHFSTIAEGVELKEQLTLLKRLGCENYQGFLKSKAVTPSKAALFLKKVN